MPIYSVTELKQEFYDYLKNAFSKSSFNTELNIVLIGNDFASSKYVEMKKNFGLKLGVKTNLLHYGQFEKPSYLIELFENFIKRGGALVQLPAPENCYEVVKKIPYQIDVDLMGLEALKLWDLGFLPPTIGAIDLILKSVLSTYKLLSFENKLTTQISLEGLKVAVIGQGNLVGKPLLNYLTKANATIISLNKSSPEIQDLSKIADILISATGVANLVDNKWLAKPVIKNNLLWPIVIDAGTSEGKILNKENEQEKSVLVGDVNSESVANISTLFGVPGGVGPLTVRYIFYNLLKLSRL